MIQEQEQKQLRDQIKNALLMGDINQLTTLVEKVKETGALPATKLVELQQTLQLMNLNVDRKELNKKITSLVNTI